MPRCAIETCDSDAYAHSTCVYKHASLMAHAEWYADDALLNMQACYPTMFPCTLWSCGTAFILQALQLLKIDLSLPHMTNATLQGTMFPSLLSGKESTCMW